MNKANEILTSHKLPAADIYVGEDVWKEMCGRDDIDLVYICTDWHSHAPMAVYAMKQGKHVAVEVPAAMTVAECWDLVNTAEQTRRHCMMLETSVLMMMTSLVFSLNPRMFCTTQLPWVSCLVL